MTFFFLACSTHRLRRGGEGKIDELMAALRAVAYVIKTSTIDPKMVTRPSKVIVGGLFGRTREAVLGLLLLRPDERFHLRQIARICGTGLGAVQRELSALTQMGILQRER